MIRSSHLNFLIEYVESCQDNGILVFIRMEVFRIESYKTIYTAKIQCTIFCLDARIVIELLTPQSIRKIIQRLNTHRFRIEVRQPVTGTQPEMLMIIFQNLVDHIAGKSLFRSDTRKSIIRLIVTAESTVLGCKPQALFTIFKSTGNPVVTETVRVLHIMTESLYFLGIRIISSYSKVISCEPDISVLIFQDIADEHAIHRHEYLETIYFGHIRIKFRSRTHPSSIPAICINGKYIIIEDRIWMSVLLVMSAMICF